MPRGRPKKKLESEKPDELDLGEDEEDSSDLEASFLDDQGRGAVSHGRRVRSRIAEERESSELPDEAPPGWPGSLA